MDYKSRVKKAIAGYYDRQETVDHEPQRKNEKPEKEVEREILVWCKQNGFCVDVIEAKSKFSTSTMQYTGRAASAGFPDLVGNTFDGLAVFIELKAPGRRVGSALRENQRNFLSRKIEGSCFAIVADSVKYVEDAWIKFQSLSPADRILFLLSELPKHNPRQISLFD